MVRNAKNAKGSVNFVQWNARNFNRFKAQEITPLATNADVLMIQECGSYLPHIVDFSIASHDLRGQGTAIYVRNTVEYREWNPVGLQNTGNEGDFVVCGVRIGDLLAISIYIRPLGSTTLESRREFVNKVIDIARIEEKMVIGGDLNDHGRLFSNHNDVPTSPWDPLVNEDLNDFLFADAPRLSNNSIMQLYNDGSITRPESGRALDASFGKGVKCQDWLVASQGHYSSDHYPIWFSVQGVEYECYKPLRPKRSRKLKLIDWKKIKRKLKHELKQRDSSLQGKEVIEWWCNKATQHLIEHSHRSKKTYCPFWSDELKTLKGIRNRLRRQGNFQAYKEADREFKRCFRRAKRHYMRSNLMEIAESHNPFEELYRFVPALKKKKCIKPMLHKQDAKKTANGLSNQFQSISRDVRDRRSDLNIDERLSKLVDSDMTTLSPHELLCALSKAKKRSSTGSDEIGYGVWMKLCETDVFLTDIAKAMDNILRHAEIPEQWLHAIIHPIPKDSGGFRPIALLNCISKLLEGIVNRRFATEISQRRIQFGCRSGHSTQHAITRLLHKSAMAVEDDAYFLCSRWI